MSTLSFYFAVILSLVLISCNTENTKNQGLGVKRIDLEMGLNNSHEANLSEIADSVIYIKLETSDVALVHKPDIITLNGDDLFIVENRLRTLLRFTKDGKFINSIGSFGSEIDQFVEIGSIDLDPVNQFIFVMDRSRGGRILKFSYNGLFEKILSTNTGFRVIKFENQIINFYPQKYLILSDFRRVVIENIYSGSEISLMPQKNQSITDLRKLVSFNTGLFRANNGFTLWMGECDTIYQITKNSTCNPKFVLDFGKYKIPDNIKRDIDLYEIQKYNYPFILDIIETDSMIFFNILFERRLNTVIYLKGEDLCFNTKMNKGKIKNNVDDGLAFWPSGIMGENLLYMRIDMIDLLQYAETINTNKPMQSDFDKKIMISSINDNPMLMILKLNNK